MSTFEKLLTFEGEAPSLCPLNYLIAFYCIFIYTCVCVCVCVVFYACVDLRNQKKSQDHLWLGLQAVGKQSDFGV